MVFGLDRIYGQGGSEVGGPRVLEFWPAYDCLIDVRVVVVTPELLSWSVPTSFLTFVQEIPHVASIG
jgi:hypothetical protein